MDTQDITRCSVAVALKQEKFFTSTFCQQPVRNGIRTLFYRQTVEALQSPDSPEQVADYFAWLGEAVRKDGFELSVVLVPDKYQIYAPLLAEDISRDNGSKALLHDVEAALLRKGIEIGSKKWTPST